MHWTNLINTLRDAISRRFDFLVNRFVRDIYRALPSLPDVCRNLLGLRFERIWVARLDSIQAFVRVPIRTDGKRGEAHLKRLGVSPCRVSEIGGSGVGRFRVRVGGEGCVNSVERRGHERNGCDTGKRGQSRRRRGCCCLCGHIVKDYECEGQEEG